MASPIPSKAPAGQRSKPPTFRVEDFSSLANPAKQVSAWARVFSPSPATTTTSSSYPEILKELQAMQKRIEVLALENQGLKATQAAPPLPPSEPVAMPASDCSDDKQDSR